jgi:hypothetical protein
MSKQFKRRMRRNYVGKTVSVARPEHPDLPPLTGEVERQELMLEVKTSDGVLIRVPVWDVTVIEKETIQ